MINIHSLRQKAVLDNVRQRFKKPFINLTFELLIRIKESSNCADVSIDDLVEWSGSKSKMIRDSLPKEMERVGYWIKIEKNTYMINPDIMYFSQRKKLTKIYKNYGGVTVIIKNQPLERLAKLS